LAFGSKIRGMVKATAIVCLMGFAGIMLFGPASPSLSPQDSKNSNSSDQLAFEVASVKPSPQPKGPDDVTANVELSSSDAYVPTGGYFSAKAQWLEAYIAFAYKLNAQQAFDVYRQEPKWATTQRYTIEARAPQSNPTKDQLRAMMRNLLLDRFKLSAHFTSRQTQVTGLLLAKPGVLGPKLRPYSSDPPCPVVGLGPAATALPTTAPSGSEDLPSICGESVFMPTDKRGFIKYGARNVSMRQIADDLNGMPGFGRIGVGQAIKDMTGLTGTFDYSMEIFDTTYPNRHANPEMFSSAPTPEDELADQLGLKLRSTTASVDFLVIDRIEQPQGN
jgi:uncharacterized protein (TIGR03435 family)